MIVIQGRKITLRKAESTEEQGREMRRWDVLADGEEVGQLYQTRESTRQCYAGKMYGYDTWRTVWASDLESWEGYGSRKEALAGWAEHYADDLTREAAAAEREAAAPKLVTISVTLTLLAKDFAEGWLSSPTELRDSVEARCSEIYSGSGDEYSLAVQKVEISA